MFAELLMSKVGRKLGLRVPEAIPMALEGEAGVFIRNIAGTRQHFRETFHDEGRTDMVKMLRAYHEVGFDGPMRPDHAPTLDEETNDRPGYAIQGKVFAIGYMKGVMQGLGLPYA